MGGRGTEVVGLFRFRGSKRESFVGEFSPQPSPSGRGRYCVEFFEGRVFFGSIQRKDFACSRMVRRGLAGISGLLFWSSLVARAPGCAAARFRFPSVVRPGGGAGCCSFRVESETIPGKFPAAGTNGHSYR